MTKDKEIKEEKNIVAVEEALSRTEQFIEKNQKLLLYIIGGIVLIIGGYIGFKKLYLAPKEKEAQGQMFMAVKYFEMDSINKAVAGDGNYLGFESIIEDYGMTKAANQAHYYLGICYLRQGNFEGAISELEDFDTDEVVLKSMAIGAIGDATMELGDVEKAASYYVDAAEEGDNSFTSPVFLMKAGLAYEEMKNYEKATEVYEKIRKDYFRSYESREAEKYLARVKLLSGKEIN